MSFVFGHNSRNNLTGVHPDLIKCCNKALGYGLMDFSVIQGVRTQEEQDGLYSQGRTQPGKIVTWTKNSKHLLQEDGHGHAVDIVPYPLNWNDTEAFKYLATLMFRAANELCMEIEWGGHWSKKHRDYPHYEIIV